jgi:aminoglycoside phosphotransferase (APT) family kinase protein
MDRTGDLAAALAPMPGGYSGETFLAEVAGERTVVRIYAGRGATRGPSAAEVDAAVLRLVHRLVPVPEVLEVRRADPGTGAPGLLVTGFLPGARGDEVIASADDALLTTLGHRLGEVLARLAQMPMLRPGRFLDGELRIGPWPVGAEDLAAWVGAALDGPVLAQWASADQAALLDLADHAQDLADTGDRWCLVHSDFNPKNLLVAADTAVVTGVLDWEFAHAGSPFADLGNLLRFDRKPALVEAVCQTYSDLVVDAPADLLDQARAADMWALVELASRAGQSPVADRAHDRLLAMARTGDLHAVKEP